MSLVTKSKEDFKRFTTNSAHFGEPVTLVDPAGTRVDVVGFFNDIGKLIDPDTGQDVSGRLKSVVISTMDLGEIPRGLMGTTTPPWRVEIAGIPYKIFRTMPDRGMECVILLLEVYTDD